jgi:Asp-tRNA(Asn)/Glu-tRNA(Gln) amidotransferase A subunit family amidase
VVGFKPTWGMVPITGCFPLAPSFDHAGPMARDVGGCERMMRVLVPGFETVELDSLADVRAGVAWAERAEPLVRRRVEEATARFPDCAAVDVPMPHGLYPAFQREAAEVHVELFAAHRALYGDNVAVKIDEALGVDDAAVAAAEAARERYREEVAQAFGDLDVVLTPTLLMVAPATGIGDLVLRAAMIKLTFPWNAVGAPALALPCGPAEDGLPASIQIVGRPGADALVLAVGRLLEAALAI